MKYLFNHVETNKHLQIWAGATPLVQVSFYFWIPGQKMQKSIEGLLQTLLYHILSACPDLVSVLCPERSVQPHTESGALRPWSLSELQKTFQIFRSRNDVTTKFYFHIDGLDEYYGDSWDVIHTLQDLATCTNVKMCLSSRPWNSFQDAFGRSNPYVIRLHDWTKRDIKIFAYETLMAYAVHSEFEPSLFDDLIRDIAERAQGVFLWVRLVVHSLRDGIVNDDPVSILHERLRAIPTDLEDFFKHILESVEDVYRPRMARTFLAALYTQEPLQTIHYHFLDEEDATFDSKSLITPWPDPKIQQVVNQTHRRLNGRFRGLLEPSVSKAITKNPTVDFLHRTLRDFLGTERMINWLKTQASTESNLRLAMGRALIATGSVVVLSSVVDNVMVVKKGIELASLAAKETGNAKESHTVVDLAHDMYQRAYLGHRHVMCGLNCHIVHFAFSVGLVDYIRHCAHKRATKANINRILRHALCCPQKMHDTFIPCLPETLSACNSQTTDEYGSKGYNTRLFGHSLSPDMVKTLLDLGADPNAVVESTSSWTFALREAVVLMDTSRSEQCLNVLEVFLKKSNHLDSSLFEWDSLFSRPKSSTEEGMRNTLRYLELFFSHDVSPNLTSQGTTLFDKYLRTLPNATKRLFTGFGTARQRQHDILLAFLQAGADVTQVYKDESKEAWFPNFSRELSSNFSDQTKVAEFRLFLEYGLDPNAVLRGSITVWYRLLGMIYQIVRQQQDFRFESQHRVIHQIMLLSIQHGADPRAPGLPRILQWMRSPSCLWTAKEVAEIEEALPSPTLIVAGGVAGRRKRKGDDDRGPNCMSRAKKRKP